MFYKSLFFVKLAIDVHEQERMVMSTIKTFLRSLAQAFGISSPQQVKPRLVSRPLNPPARPGPAGSPSRSQPVTTTKKDE